MHQIVSESTEATKHLSDKETKVLSLESTLRDVKDQLTKFSEYHENHVSALNLEKEALKIDKE